MITLTDLTCHYNPEFTEPHSLISGQAATLGYAPQIREHINIEIVKHAAFEGTATWKQVPFYFFKGSNRFGYLSRKTAAHLRLSRPDIILLQGLIYPLQIIYLRLLLGKKLVIMVQHHGEQPFPWHKRWLQKLADKYTSAYIFTSLGNARPWLKTVIGKADKCYEILEASTGFVKQDKEKSKLKLGLSGDWNFLWVGRLNVNKDPLAVLHGFAKYLEFKPAAKLYWIYQTDELLAELTSFTDRNENVKNAVHFIGSVKHQDLQDWYSAAEIFISGSHREGSGFALIEAMSCGCLPVVTDIPTFRKITNDGRFGILYEAGNSNHLFESLKRLENISREEMSTEIVTYFNKELSFKAIAGKLYELCKKLV